MFKHRMSSAGFKGRLFNEEKRARIQVERDKSCLLKALLSITFPSPT